MRRWRPQLHSAFTAAVEVMALVLLATLFGRIMYGLYQNISADRAVVQAIPAVAVVSVWLFFMNRTRARETYGAEPESGADQEGFGARTVRLDPASCGGGNLRRALRPPPRPRRAPMR
jgi:hypothetical protein